MKYRKLRIVGAVLCGLSCLLFIGWPVRLSPRASASDLDALIARQGSATFRSFNGKWIGLDCDTDLTFLSNGAFHMFEYGVGVNSFFGTYNINSLGQISLQLPTFGQKWPAMLLKTDATSLLLVPAPGETDFVMGSRGSATLSSGQGTYWPFRPLNEKEEVEFRSHFMM